MTTAAVSATAAMTMAAINEAWLSQPQLCDPSRTPVGEIGSPWRGPKGTRRLGGGIDAAGWRSGSGLAMGTGRGARYGRRSHAQMRLR
jgi:hypothetical protein